MNNSFVLGLYQSIDIVDSNYYIRHGVKPLVKEEKNMTKRMSAENPAPYTPTFYGVDRRERLENHLTKVSDDSLPFSDVVNGVPEVEESEDQWRRRNGWRR